MEVALEVPRHIQLDKMAAVISVSDQGAVNRGGLHFLAYSKHSVMIGLQWDPFHRCWNDIKASLKQAEGFPWRMVLSLSIFYNLAYGPFNSGEFFSKKAQMAKEFFMQNSPHQEPFTSYISMIAWECGMKEPSEPEDIQALWEQIQEAPHWSNKGPLVKLCRWLSFFQSAKYFQSDLMAAKMVLSKTKHIFEDTFKDDGLLPVEEPNSGKKDQDVRAELKNLKMAEGTFSLAPRLISNTFIMQKDIVCIVTAAACKHHAEDARELLTAKQILDHTVSNVTNQGWAAELAFWLQAAPPSCSPTPVEGEGSCYIAQAFIHFAVQVDCCRDLFFSVGNIKFLFRDNAVIEDSKVKLWALDYFTHLVSNRAKSLATQYCTPPVKYAAIVGQDPQTAQQAFDQCMKDWRLLLQMESAASQGATISALDHCHWRLAPLTRCATCLPFK